MATATLISNGRGGLAIFGTRLSSVSRRGNNVPVGLKQQTGRSSCAAWAYLARTSILDERQGIEFDYSVRDQEDLVGVIWLQSDWAKQHNVGASPQDWWNAVEASESRCDAETAKEFRVDYPRCFTSEQLVRTHTAVMQNATIMLAKHGHVLDVVGGTIHCSKASDGGMNPHGDVLFGVREVNRDDTETTGALVFSKRKYRKLSGKVGGEIWSEIRKVIAQTVSEHALEAGLALYDMIDIDHRTLKMRRDDALEFAAELDDPDSKYVAVFGADAASRSAAEYRARAQYWNRPAARKVGPVRHRRAMLIADRDAGYPVKMSALTRVSDADVLRWAAGRERVADAAGSSALRAERYKELRSSRLERLTAAVVDVIEKFARKLWALVQQSVVNASNPKTEIQAMAPDHVKARIIPPPAPVPTHTPQPMIPQLRAPVATIVKPAENRPLPPLVIGPPARADQASPEQTAKPRLATPAAPVKAAPSAAAGSGVERLNRAPGATVPAEQKAPSPAASSEKIVTRETVPPAVTAAPAPAPPARPRPPLAPIGPATVSVVKTSPTAAVSTAPPAATAGAMVQKAAAASASASGGSSAENGTLKRPEAPKLNTTPALPTAKQSEAQNPMSAPPKAITANASPAPVSLAQLAVERQRLDEIFRKIASENLPIQRRDEKIMVAGLGDPDHALLNAAHHANSVGRRLAGIQGGRQQQGGANKPDGSTAIQAANNTDTSAALLVDMQRKERAKQDRDVLNAFFERIVRDDVDVKKTEKGWSVGRLNDAERAALTNPDLQSMVHSRLEGISKKRMEAAQALRTNREDEHPAPSPVTEPAPPNPMETAPSTAHVEEAASPTEHDSSLAQMMWARRPGQSR